MPSVSTTKQKQLQQQAMQLRDELLAECGWPMKARQQLLGNAIKTLEKQLNATKTIVVDKTMEEVEDNQAQLRAAEAIVALEGVSVGKSTETGGTMVMNVTINAPWFEPGPTTGSGEGHVIEIGQSNLLIDKES